MNWWRGISSLADGNVLVVGAPGSDGNAGRGLAFAFDEDSWEYVPRGPAIEGEGPRDRVGEWVDTSSDGSVVVVGAPGRGGVDGSGLVRVFAYDSGAGVHDLGGGIKGDFAGDRLGGPS